MNTGNKIIAALLAIGSFSFMTGPQNYGEESQKSNHVDNNNSVQTSVPDDTLKIPSPPDSIPLPIPEPDSIPQKM